MSTSTARVRRSRRDVGLAMVVDGLIVAATLWWALLLRFEGEIPAGYYQGFLLTVPIAIGAVLLSGHLMGLYRIVRKYTSLGEAWRIAKVVTLTAGAILVLSQGYYLLEDARLLPLSIPLIWAPPAFLGLVAPRVFRRFVAHFKLGKSVRADADRVLIVGAGDAGEHIVRDALRNPDARLHPVAFVDDDPTKVGRRIHGLPVAGGIEDLAKVVGEHSVDKVVIALPNAPSRLVRTILDLVAESGAQAQIVPTLPELMGEQPTSAHIRDVDIGDLIGRRPVEVDVERISKIFKGRVVLVSGAAGTIGSELAQQALRFRPSQLLLLDNNETDLYLLKEKLSPVACAKGTQVQMILADVRDRRRIEGVFRQYAPAMVLHAAAYKHVSVMEACPAEAVKTNVTGTRNLAEAARDNGALKFVLVSTDKAVNPTSVMGATKRAAEMVLSTLAEGSETAFSSVRFGNVLGSRGSVVPIMAEQIANGGPITVTHEHATRYFMTIKEAAALICQAGAIAQGGETFVLEMGEPVRIMDLAIRMRDLLAKERAEEIDIVLIGLRQGEKLHEDLWHTEEVLLGKVQAGILKARSAIDTLDKGQVDEGLRELEALAEMEGDHYKIVEQLELAVGCMRLPASLVP